MKVWLSLDYYGYQLMDSVSMYMQSNVHFPTWCLVGTKKKTFSGYIGELHCCGRFAQLKHTPPDHDHTRTGTVFPLRNRNILRSRYFLDAEKVVHTTT